MSLTDELTPPAGDCASGIDPIPCTHFPFNLTWPSARLLRAAKSA